MSHCVTSMSRRCNSLLFLLELLQANSMEPGQAIAGRLQNFSD
jgi:hypothetical protein